MENFKTFMEVGTPFYNQLMAMRSNMAQAAQKIYNEWDQNDDMCDPGGICDEIASEIGGICVEIPGCEIVDGGQAGDDHAWIIAHNNKEAYGVDIPPHLYERGGGYCWKKIEGVTFTPDDVEIWNLGLSAMEIRQLDEY